MSLSFFSANYLIESNVILIANKELKKFSTKILKQKNKVVPVLNNELQHKTCGGEVV
jgi:hypothetical protein